MRRLRERLARQVLFGFEPDEVEDVLQDLEELSAGKGRLTGAIYYWYELIKYPARLAWDRLSHRGHEKLGTGGGGAMDGFWKDARYAVRSLVRSFGFTTMTVVIMMVGIGATTTIISVVKGVLLDPLPGDEPDRVVSVWIEQRGTNRARMTPGNFTDISGLEGVFSDVAAFGARTASLTGRAEPVFLRGGAVTPRYFEALGVRPAVGRTFRPAEGVSDGPAVIVLSHHVWQQAYGGDPDIVGRSLSLDGSPFEVIGVAPPGLYPTRATVSAEIPFTTSNQDFFVPLRYSHAGWSNRRSHVLGMVGRLAPGRSAEGAQSALGTLSARLQAEEPLNANEAFLVTPFREEVVGDVRFALLTILGSVGLLLLIALANVGALFILRADDRQPEIAIRVALGAPRVRLVRQLLLESAVVAGAAGLGAVFVSQWILVMLKTLVPYQIPRLSDVGIDGTGLVAVGVLALVITAVLGLAPASRLFGRRWARVAAQQSHTAGRGQRRLQGGMVAIQAGLGVVVLVGAALLARSFAALRAVDTGFASKDTWVMSVPAPLPTLEEIARQVRGMPGVSAAAIAYDHPLQRNWGDGFLIEGVELSDTERPPSGSLRAFGEGYFDAVGIEVLEGRVPDGIDMSGSVAYAVVNHSLSETFFPGGDAVGSRIVVPTAQRMMGTDGVFEVVGVVEDVRFLGPDQPPSPAFYLPLSHFPAGASMLLVRPEREGIEVVAGVRQIVRDTDRAQAVQQAQRLRDILDDLLARPRFNMMLLVSFGLMGLTLCGLGAYALVGRVVVTRFREIGIRIALGENRSSLARSIVGSALRPMIVGGLVGVALSAGLVQLIRSLLFEVSPGDPISFALSAAFVLLVGAVAAILPTVRALSIDPASTLRSE